MRLSKALSLSLLALALLSAGAGLAQEEAAEAPSGPWPYFYIVKSKVDSTMLAEYAGAVGQIVSAHQQHDNGNVWAAFSPLTGGSDPVFYYFVPMWTMGEMDGWSTNYKLVRETLGEEAAGKVLQTLSNASKSKNMVLAYSPELSNPDPDGGLGPPNYAWTIHSKVQPGTMGDYMALVQKIKEAHQAHDDGYRWTAYMPVIGGQSGEIYYFIGLDKMGEIDGWVPVEKIEAEHMGEAEAAAARKAAAEMATSSSMILALSKSFSNLPPPPDD